MNELIDTIDNLHCEDVLCSSEEIWVDFISSLKGTTLGLDVCLVCLVSYNPLKFFGE